jgi:nucleotide-binding universal stress UspA family protein
MKKQILVPLDGSRLAETAIPHAVALAAAQDCSVILLRVIPVPPSMTAAAWGMPPSEALWESWDEEVVTAEKYLETVADRLLAETTGLHVDVNTALLKGDPAPNIISYVEHHPEVMTIAMSTHGRSGLGRWVFGSVAEKVLQGSSVPLLLVRRKEGEVLPEHFEPPIYDSLLVPLDGSDFAAQALQYAEDLALCTKACITLLSAVPDAPLLTDLVAPPVMPMEWEDETQRYADYLTETTRDMRARGFMVNSRIEHNRPADAILHFAHINHPALILMATHGRSGLSRLWLGSVAMKVVQAAGCPVLLVRVKERVEQERAVSQPELQAV